MKKAKKILTLVACAVLLVCISVGATIAYLTASESVLNTFTVGDVKIKLDEALANEDGLYVTDHDNRTEDGNEYHLLPGHTYYKDPTVTVLKNSEDCYVRIQVTVKDYDKLADAVKLADTETEQYTYEVDGVVYPALHQLVSGWKDDIWVYKSVKDVSTTTGEGEEAVPVKKAVYEFWYFDVVKKNTDDTVLEDLFEAITLPEEVDNDALATLASVEIEVVAHAIQTDGFEDTVDGDGNVTETAAEKAWAAWGN